MWQNESRNSDADEAAGSVTFDPFADLLLGLIAIIVPVISLLLASGSGLTAVEEKPVVVQSAAEDVFVIIANKRGLVLPAQNGQQRLVEVAVRQILDDGELIRILHERRDMRLPVSLLIEPDGLESAFLFEAVAAQHGPATIQQRRVGSASAGVAR